MLEYTSLLSPLVSVSGLGSLEGQNVQKPPHESVEELVVCEGRVEDTPVSQKVAKGLQKRSAAIGPWDPILFKQDRLHFQFQDTLYIPDATVKPSPLSPKNPDCDSPIFTADWLKKITLWIPCVSILFCNFPRGEEEENDLIDALISLKNSLSSSNTHLMAVVIGSDSDLARVIPHLRKETGLSAKYGLFALPEDFNDAEVNSFVQYLYQTALTLSREFLNSKINSLRAKRQAVAPPLDLLLWDARYTLKIAYCSELKGDLAGAVKLYESAYDTLALLFENRAIKVDSPEYMNAREVLDALAVKNFQYSLPSQLAMEKLLVHISTVEHLWELNGIDGNSKKSLLWKAVQYFCFAQLCEVVKEVSSVARVPSQQLVGISTGLVWLDAAKLFSKVPKENTEDDPYVPRGAPNENQNAQFAFLRAISDLSQNPRSKAYALAQYGDWLARTDSAAALEAFKSSRRVLTGKSWPQVSLHLSNRLNDKFMQFALGDTETFDVDSAEAAEWPLFTCSGTFEIPETHIGREVRAQVTLTPRFPGTLSLRALNIKTTLGTLRFEDTDSDSRDSEYLVHAAHSLESDSPTPANLRFQGQLPRTFQFALTSVDTGEIELLEVEIEAGSKFSQTIAIAEGPNTWLKGPGLPSPRTVMHLPVMARPLIVQVNTRPALLDISDHSPSVVAVDEKVKIHMELKSREEEDITSQITTRLIEKNTNEERLLLEEEKVIESHGPYVDIRGEFDAPLSVVELVLTAKFNTSTDTLPVVFEYRKIVDVIKPFRVSFDLVPQYMPQKWPAVFAPQPEVAAISRKWKLNSAALSLFPSTDIVLHQCNFHIKSESHQLDVGLPELDMDGTVMHHNSSKRFSHSFISHYQPGRIPIVKTIEALAHVELVWSRNSDRDVKNRFKLPPVKLNLPTQEPRVLVVADKKGSGAEISQVTFHIENSTATLLNFSISMASSTYFAFQGPKAITLRMLPYSSRALTYQLIPLGEGAVQNRRPLPDLRVYDINYKRTLAIFPGDDVITFEQNSLFI